MTNLEKKMAKAVKIGFEIYENPWISEVIRESGIAPKIARGVIASLEKKGIITICHNSPEGKYISEFTEKEES